MPTEQRPAAFRAARRRRGASNANPHNASPAVADSGTDVPTAIWLDDTAPGWNTRSYLWATTVSGPLAGAAGLIVLFVVVHVLLVLVSGLVNNMRGMITGWFSLGRDREHAR